MKLSTRLTLHFLILSLVPLLSIIYLAYLHEMQSIKQNTFNRLTSINILKAAEVSRWINGSRIHIQALAQRPLILSYAKQITSGTLPQKRLARVKKKLLENHFKPSISQGTGYLDISLLNQQDGKILASTEKKLEGKYKANRDFFIEGQRRTYVEDMAYEVGLEQLVMHISTPVKADDGQTIAVLSGHLDWEEMSEIMAQGSKATQSEESYLVNQFNYLVTRSRFQADLALKKTIHTPGVERCLHKEQGVGMYDDYRSVPILGAFRWMEEWNLCILTEIDQKEAFEPVRKFRLFSIGIGLVATIIAAALNLLFTRTITWRTDRLVQGALEIGKGNLNYRLPTSPRDEIGQIAESINDMARARKKAEETIKIAHHELEDRVAERTTELSYKNFLLLDEIKERRQVETALRTSEENYRLLLNILDTGVVVHDADSSILLSNQSSQQLLGLSRDQMLGKKTIDTAWHFVRADNSLMPLEEYPVNQVIATGKPLKNFILGINKPESDETTWVSVNAFPELDSKEKIHQVVVTFWDITSRIVAEAKLQNSLSEKEVLLREIHHRVKNNMQMIQSLTNLQAMKVKNAEFKQALTDSTSRIKSMALIHETLYRSEDLAKLDLKKYFQQLIKHLLKLYRHTKNPIDIHYNIDPIILDMDSSISCGLLVNELVTNALKYAFDDKGHNIITIALRQLENTTIELVVADNGKGLPGPLEEIAQQSLGLQIVTMLAVDQLQGSISTEADEGARFQIRFSLTHD